MAADRRRRPVPVAVGLALASALARTAGFPAGAAAFGVAQRCRTGPAVAVAVLLAAVTVCDLAVRQHGQGGLLAYGSVVLLSGVGLLVGLFARARRELVAVLRERALRAEAEQRHRAEEARRAERLRIAREMHDALAHRLSVLSLHAGALASRPDAPAAQIARSAEIVRAGAHDALLDLKDVVGVLRGAQPPADPPSTPRNFLELADEARRAGSPVALDAFPASWDGVPDSVRRDVYCVLQEALTNAREHAPGHLVTVRIDRTAHGIRIGVHNRLTAAAHRPHTIPGDGFGPAGLRERAALAGGSLEHGRHPDGTFRLSAWLPWQP
ncbi:sensor histidine kinase [Streptomyces sp. NPDC048644]|uniref:sensor histidine kinase n=1 Tax=Streptomyces sp. NPDC048644 TaxID=3365582 RepID=UPI00371FAAFA